MLSNVLLVAFWLICICVVAIGWSGILSANEIDIGTKGVVVILILMGAPFIIISNLISALLDTMLPPGWDNNDEGEI